MASGVADQEIRLGRYTLKRPLGEGGNGQVFLAWQENAAGEPLVCVVKFPLQRYATDDEGCKRFLDEARLAMRLGTHLNIVHVIDVGVHRAMPFIVMEYVDGTDLRSLLKFCRKRGEGLSLPTVYSILSGAAAGLHHAHAGATVAREPVGVVHRDVKPGNILVTRDGITKLGDFGISTTVQDGTTGSYMRGTFRYMSPEHISREVRPEMDVYALGVVAWEMVENRQYRDGYEGTQHFTAIMDGKVPPLVNPATPKEFRVIIEACLEPNPRQRPSAKELLIALEQCPGYTRYASDLQDVISSVVGPHRSSGKTLHELAVTPELAATFAALEAVEKRAKSAPAPAPKVVVAPPKLEAPTTIEGPHAFVAGLPARRREESVDRDDSEVETRKRPAAPEVSGADEDVPQKREWRRATPAMPTTTVAISTPEHTPIPPTVALEDWPARPSASGTQRVPAPPEGDLPPVASGLRGQTEPAATARPSSSTPGALRVTAPETLDTKTESVVVRERGIGLLPLILVCVGLAVTSSLVVAYLLGAFEPEHAVRSGPGKAPKPEAQSRDSTVELELRAPKLPAERPAPLAVAAHQPSVGAAAKVSHTAVVEPPEPKPRVEALPPAASAAGTVAHQADANEHDLSEAEPASPKGSPPPKPARKTVRPAPAVPVKVVLFLIDAAEVKIGPKTVTVSRGTDIQVPAGRHRIRWRVPGEPAWRTAGPKRFAADHRYLVRLQSARAEVIALDPGGSP